MLVDIYGSEKIHIKMRRINISRATKQHVNFLYVYVFHLALIDLMVVYVVFGLVHRSTLELPDVFFFFLISLPYCWVSWPPSQKSDQFLFQFLEIYDFYTHGKWVHLINQMTIFCFTFYANANDNWALWIDFTFVSVIYLLQFVVAFNNRSRFCFLRFLCECVCVHVCVCLCAHNQ